METTYLTHTYLETSDQAGGMGRGENPQRFADRDQQIALQEKRQRDTKALQISKGAAPQVMYCGGEDC